MVRNIIPTIVIFNYYQGYGLNSTLAVSVYATDTLGASSRATSTVTTTPYTDGVLQLSESVDDLANAALASGDTNSLMQVHRTRFYRIRLHGADTVQC